jgi:hypothetical protein
VNNRPNGLIAGPRRASVHHSRFAADAAIPFATKVDRRHATAHPSTLDRVKMDFPGSVVRFRRRATASIATTSLFQQPAILLFCCVLYQPTGIHLVGKRLSEKWLFNFFARFFRLSRLNRELGDGADKFSHAPSQTHSPRIATAPDMISARIAWRRYRARVERRRSRAGASPR